MNHSHIPCKVYSLYRSSGYADHTLIAQGTNLAEIQQAMEKDYNSMIPEDWMDESREMSYIDDDRAIMYYNGEDVYEWLISQVNISDFITPCNPNQVFWAKTDATAILPSKNAEDAGYDIYAKNRIDDITIQPNETVMIPTGICSVFHSSKVAILKERGSTGTMGLGQRSGVIDSGYRGEWLVPITNHNDKPVIMTSDIELFKQTHPQADSMFKIYSLKKAICQVIFLNVPEMTCSEITLENLQECHSIRGDGKLGSSGK